MAKVTKGQINKLAKNKGVAVTNYNGLNMHTIVLPCGLQCIAKDRAQANKWISALPDITVEMAQRALAEELMEQIRSVTIDRPSNGGPLRLIVLVDTNKTLDNVQSSVGPTYLGYPVVVVLKLTDLNKVN
jgi:hypothetical protein